MAEVAFPVPVADVVTTLAEVYRHRGDAVMVELLENANPSVDMTNYDNWNGGTYTWALRLALPVTLYAHFEERLPKIEKDLLAKLGYIEKNNPGHQLGEVTVAPTAPGIAIVGARLRPSEKQIAAIWPAKRFRLFLSHVSAHKEAVGKLKEALADRGIAAFVAHEDIKPSLEWQAQIEIGLKSMHALAAILTEDFHASDWTDQEVGWGLGRGVLVLPVRFWGTVPYGLAGKVQGLKGDFRSPGVTAGAILCALMTNEQTAGEMRRCLVPAFCGSTSYVMSLALSKIIVGLTDLSVEEVEALRRACTDNGNITDAYGVADTIYHKVGRPAAPVEASLDEDVPF